MDNDFDDLEDDKSKVRSAIDALGDFTNNQVKKKGRGRPRKYPGEASASSSKRTKSTESEPESTEDEQEEEITKKKRKKGSEDEEWDEERESLSMTQRRIRKKPTLYSEESVASEQRRKVEKIARRGSQMQGRKSRGRPRIFPESNREATYNKQVQTTLSKEETDQLNQLKQQWKDIENPMQAKLRMLPFLRRALFEKALGMMTPVPGGARPATAALLDPIKEVFAQLTCSAGFLEFIDCIPEAACIAIYDICDKLFVLSSQLSDHLKVAQALRFWWNCLSFATRRNWEKHARRLVYGKEQDADLSKRPCAAGYEVPIDRISKERLAQEQQWEDRQGRVPDLLDEVDMMITCPLCEKTEGADPVKMITMKDIQEHFFNYHWQAHGYACHFCGLMFSTARELMTSHAEECEDWMKWNAERILHRPKSGQMSCSRMMLCCADCGWHATLSKDSNEKKTISNLRAFLSNHNNDGLLAMIVYFAGAPSEEMESVRFSVTCLAGGDPLAPCVHCTDTVVTFRDPSEANEHYRREHKDKPLVCVECEAKSTTKYLLNLHSMTHIHENSYFADYLSNSARVFPPPTNLSCAPRSGWRERAKSDNYAYGGVMGEIGMHGVDLVGPNEDVRELKVRLANQRRNEGKPAQDAGFESAEVEEETNMAKKIREKLLRKYSDCEGIGSLEDPIWLRDEDALKLKDWMEYWESAEGRKLGGPPKMMEVDVSPSIIRIGEVEVEVQFKDASNISGFTLNDNIFYCMACDTMLKGEQAAAHLKDARELRNRGEGENKCAMSDGVEEKDPHKNLNMFQIFSFAVSEPDAALPCPHCAFKGCSITGVRVHVLRAHGIFVQYAKYEDENATPLVTLRFDIRSKLAKILDANLGMLPSGMLPQVQPLVTDPLVLTDDTWSQIIHTRENTPAALLTHMKKLNDGGWITAQRRTPQPPAASAFANRAATVGGTPNRAPYQLQHQPMPVRIAPPMQQTPRLSYGGGTTMQQGRALSQYPAPSPPGHSAVVPQKSMVRLVASSGATTRKLVEFAHRHGGRDFFRCTVCGSSLVFERELVKAHLTRCHLNTCGHCTACFVQEEGARIHARRCKYDKDVRFYSPDPRLPHIRTRCSVTGCPAELSMVEMNMHMLDAHLQVLEYDRTSGKLSGRLQMVQKTPLVRNEPEVERLRYKYFGVPSDLAKRYSYCECIVCGLQFPEPAKLQTHLKYHPEFTYFCWVCPRAQSASMGTVTAIVKHIREAHIKPVDKGAKSLPCPLCQMDIINRPLQHLLYECNHNNVCQMCRDLPSFESAGELQEHRNRCHYNAIRRFECSHCSAYFATTHAFDAHTCDEASMRTSCVFCNLQFRTRKQFAAHFKSSHMKGDFCLECRLAFVEGEDLTRHIHSHGKKYCPSGNRIILMCAYGDINTEAKALYTLVSNASARLWRVYESGDDGGSEQAPVCLSDDDDVIALPSAAVAREAQQAAAAAARIMPPLPHNAASSGLTPHKVESGVDAVVEGVLNRLVEGVVRHEQDVARAREQQQAEASAVAPMELGSIEEPVDDDDDIVMLEDTGAAQRNLSARVRVEAEEEEDAAAAVGGQNVPGYKEDEEEGEHGTPKAPVMREFTPDDDDLCVVAEVDNPGCLNAATTISKQREKKFWCKKCSLRFITNKTLSDHMKKDHQFDAGQTTLTEELGIPLMTNVWICKSCCLAFQTEPQKKMHAQQHGSRSFGCENCSGCAYNSEVMNQHHRRVGEKKVSYICGECKFEFEHETSLHEHSNSRHAVPLFYFCKMCEMGSTDGGELYRHFMAGCARETRPRHRTQDEAIKCIGVCPAAQLHYQPLRVDYYNQAHAQNPGKFITPSICNHRSLVVACEKQVTCNDCKCLENIQRHVAFLGERAGKAFEEQIRPMRAAPPLLAIRQQYEQGLRNSGRGGHAPSNPARPYQNCATSAWTGSLARPPQMAQIPGQRLLEATQEAQRRFNDKLQSATAALGQNGVGRPPVLTPATVGGHLHNGGPAILRHPRLWPPPGVRQVAHQHPHFHPANGQHAGGPSSSSSSGRMPAQRAYTTMGSLQSLAAMANGGHAAATNNSPSPPVNASCTTCGASLLSQRDVFLHTLHTPDRGAFVCASCPIAIKEERGAVKHIINHMEAYDRMLDMDMECPFPECGVELPTMIALKNHLIRHNPPLRHRIPSCYLSFGSTALAATHEEIHQKSGSMGECCLLCGTMDNWKMEVVDNRGKNISISHLMKHAFHHRYYCKLCDMQHFEHESQMITHYIMLHTKDEGTCRSCSDCSMMMSTDFEHKEHCLAKHTVTELFVPEKVVVKIPQEFSDHIGVGIDEP